MAKKPDSATGSDNPSNPQLTDTVKESAQQIWLAGLGAFSRVHEEGNKVFEKLVKDGMSMQKQTQAAAEEKIAEAASKMASMATDIQSKAGTGWDKLETIFEDRVAKALNRLGVPSAKDVEALKAKIDELNKKVDASRAPAKKAAARPAAKKAIKPGIKPAVKPAVKRAAPRKSA